MKPPDDPHAKALWRYGVISDLIHLADDDALLIDKLRELAQKEVKRPDGRVVRLSPETLRKWLYRYREGGYLALNDKPRRDAGIHRVPENLSAAVIALREQHAQWTLSKILETLIAERLWNGCRPSRATLYRFASANALKRQPEACDPPRRPFAYARFGQLWMADFMHGPKLRCGRCFQKAILHVILDDASRYVVTARFAWKEDIRTLMEEMMRAVLRYGLCLRFYTDNGACYSSDHLREVCARLGIHLVHTPPYKPQGRGKLERFFRTLREQFLSDQSAVTLDQLNARLAEYLSDYHQKPHGGLGVSPLQKRQASGSACRPLAPAANTPLLFSASKKCRVYSDTTIRLNNRQYEVPGCLPGTRVSVRHLPWDPDFVFYGDDLAQARLVDKAANANRFQHPKGGKK